MTAVHAKAAGPVSHHTGPNALSSPVPSGPPAHAASTAVARPHPSAASRVTRAVSRQLHACARGTSAGAALRTVNQATAIAAATGTAAAAQFDQFPGPGSGTAASRGKRGNAGAPSRPSGVAVAPAPSANPGPSP